jgi:hypothetical protein
MYCFVLKIGRKNLLVEEKPEGAESCASMGMKKSYKL